MITEQQLLSQMEAHIARAKTISSPQALRDEIVALKAMCDLYLTIPAQQHSAGHAQSMSASSSHIVAQPSFQKVETKLVDEDANGDSIFDF